MSRFRSKAISAINKKGILLVYPLQNRREPASLWSELHPRTQMRWEWDEGGDSRVADLWHLRAQLSTSKEVFYAKWFQGRATFFSLDAARDLLAWTRALGPVGTDSRRILEILEMDSPLSTKQLKEAAEMQGKFFESDYERAMRPLWRRLWITGFGEIEDSSFPSLAVGATRLLFEELWDEASEIPPEKGRDRIEKLLGSTNPFWKFAVKLQKSP